jgi:hypothetical protein
MNCAEKSNPSGSGVYKRVDASQKLLHGVINQLADHRINAQQQTVAGVKVGHPHLAAEQYPFVFLKPLNLHHRLRHLMSAL